LNGGKTSDGFDYAGPLAETVQLGNVATRLAVGQVDPRTGRMETPRLIEWDAEAMRIPNLPEAEALLTRVYRAGWEVAPA
jgi:hypothetical protein